MIAIFIGAAVAALFFLIAAVLLGGWGFIAGLAACLLVMWIVAEYEKYSDEKAANNLQAVSYNPPTWGV